MGQSKNNPYLRIAPAILALFTVVALLSGLSYFTVSTRALDSQRLRDLTNHVLLKINREILPPIHMSSTMANNTWLKQWIKSGEKDSQEVVLYLAEILNRNHLLTSFFISDKTLNYYHPDGVLRKINRNNPEDNWYLEAKNMSQDYVLNIDEDRRHNNAITLFINHKVFDQQGQFIGITGVGLELNKLKQLLADFTESEHQILALIGHQGQVLLDPKRDAKPLFLDAGQLKGIISKVIASTDDYMIDRVGLGWGFGGRWEDHSIHSKYIEDLKAHLVIVENFSPETSELKESLVLMIFGLIGIVGLSLYGFHLVNKMHVQQLRKSKDLNRVINTANAPILGTDREGRITEWNQRAEKISGFKKEEVLGLPLLDIIVTDGSKRSVQVVIDKVLEGEEIQQYLLQFYTKDIRLIEVRLNSTARRDASGKIIGMIGIGQEVTELNRTRKQYESNMELLAFKDSLTDLFNRRYFYDHLKRQLEKCNDPKSVGTLFFLDMDRFKLVNDSLGHRVGDEMLKVIAQRLSSTVREGDLVCRLGGDEFVALLPFESITSAQAVEQAEKIAAKITDSLGQPIRVEGHILSAYASIGISHFTAGDSADEIIMQADNAMYLAKENMSTNIAFFTDSVHQVLKNKMDVLEAVNEALASDQFIMRYQPQYNHERELMGLEALIRWRHPRLGLLSPDKFIPLAETHHRINAIGTWVLGAVFKQVQQWREAGLTLPKVAINISSIQLLDVGFVTVVEGLAEQYKINPKQVVFEITESIGIEHFVLVQKVLEDLKVQGYRFSLDDFGTGYASMANFKRLPFSQVKVDQSFIADIEKNKDSLAIVEVVLALARSLHLEVIAEGVETQGQFDILDRLGCTGYQGYLFSKPLSVQAITSLLRSRFE